jgi:predicted amidophosphoribosyltransferase
VLVDDDCTTGATVAATARALRNAGAADITVLTFARGLSETI